MFCANTLPGVKCRLPGRWLRIGWRAAAGLALLLAARQDAGAVTGQPAFDAAAEQVTELRTLERVKSALDRSMDYMMAKQRPDGGWSQNNAGNALALLAFMGRGHVPGRGPYREVLERGKRYLLSVQDEKTGFFNGRMYEHGLSTLALAEMYGMDPDPKLEGGLRKAVDLILKAQSPSGGWRYTPTPGDQDMSVTVMQIVALRAANNAEIPVPAEVFSKAIAYVRSCAVPAGGFSYSAGGGVTPQMAAAGSLSLQLLGQYEDERIPRAMDYMATLPVQWGGGSIQYFYYFHYYAMQGHYQAGGKYWNAWHPQIRELLLDKQNTDGGWSAVSGEGEDPYPTAMASLILEVYLHFLPAYQR